MQAIATVVLATIACQFCLGSLHAWGVFAAYLKRTAGWTYVETQSVYSVELLVFALVMLTASRLMSVLGPRTLMALSGLLVGGGYTIAALGGEHEYWLVLQGIGVVAGAGLGLGYVVPIAVCIRWFPERKGLLTGIAVAGFGLGALVWGKAAGAGGNLLDTWGLSGVCNLYGAIIAAVVAVGALGLRLPDDNGTAAGDEGMSRWTVIRTPEFWLVGIAFALSAGAGLACIGLVPSYAASIGIDRVYTETAMLIGFPMTNATGRILWGNISDYIGRRLSLIIMCVTQGLLLSMLPWLIPIWWAFFIMAMLIGFNFGGNFALFPAVSGDLFGCVARHYPVVFLWFGVGGVAGPMVAAVCGDAGMSFHAFVIGGVLLIVSGLSMRLLPR